MHIKHLELKICFSKVKKVYSTIKNFSLKLSLDALYHFYLNRKSMFS